jgi:hypothetical protein
MVCANKASIAPTLIGCPSAKTSSVWSVDWPRSNALHRKPKAALGGLPACLR